MVTADRRYPNSFLSKPEVLAEPAALSCVAMLGPAGAGDEH